MSAHLLRRLSGIYRRDPLKPPADDIGIQRRHMPDRSKEIFRYIQTGFPLSRIDPKKLVDPSEINSLRMPGWIPTAIVANILQPGDQRGAKGLALTAENAVTINDLGGIAEINVPVQASNSDWLPSIHPIEIIDGQHRLWALEETETWLPDVRAKVMQIEIPVVAFHGLDRTWQAYLFYTINQLPRRIDQSLVFDLYPLLRDQEWLLRFEGPNIYRETRAQDLVILLWSHSQSPWKGRILRLGGRGKGQVTQASFIRSLTASFIRKWHNDPNKLGGLFGAPTRSHETRLSWGREQQAAFLIVAWQELHDAIVKSNAAWTKKIIEGGNRHDRIADDLVYDEEEKEAHYREELFSGDETLIAADQGVRGYMTVLNDLLIVGLHNGFFDVDSWAWNRPSSDRDEAAANDEAAVTDAITELHKNLGPLVSLIRAIVQPLADFDWRLPSGMNPNDPQYAQQASYRGSGGYRDLRRNLLLHLKSSSDPTVADLASNVVSTLGFDTEEFD